MFTLLRTTRLRRTYRERAARRDKSETAPPVRQILPSIPSGRRGIVDRALLPERDARWPDARRCRPRFATRSSTIRPEALASDFDPDRTENDSGWASVKVDPREPARDDEVPISRGPSRPRTLVDARRSGTPSTSTRARVGAFPSPRRLEAAISTARSTTTRGRSSSTVVASWPIRIAEPRATPLGDHANALTDHRTALQILPEDADLLFNTALTLQSLGDPVARTRRRRPPASTEGRASGTTSPTGAGARHDAVRAMRPTSRPCGRANPGLVFAALN